MAFVLSSAPWGRAGLRGLIPGSVRARDRWSGVSAGMMVTKRITTITVLYDYTEGILWIDIWDECLRYMMWADFAADEGALMQARCNERTVDYWPM